MNSKYLIFHLLILFSLFSCTHEIDFKELNNENNKQLTLNIIANTDSTFCVMATKSYFFSETHNDYLYVNDLQIDLYVNGVLKETLRYDESSHLYHSNYYPKELDMLMVKTKYKGKVIEATDTIPRRINIENIEVDRQGPMDIITHNDYLFTYQIKFRDPPAENNYYFLQYDMADAEGDFLLNVLMGKRDYSYEYVFQVLSNQLNKLIPGWKPKSSFGLPFTDTGIEGTEHTLIVKEIVQGEGHNLPSFKEMKRVFKLFSISENYYKYLIGILSNDKENEGIRSELINIGLASPVKVFSNIEGGTGIFGTYVLDTYYLDTFDQVGSFH